ncbi:MAG TPA: NADP-dependent oxidoreductase [Anaeromyxobacteraceae bacterium]|nr:NADP-dependent oxidoreductase [Anaeromyxobacteraceae bacterium]
MSRLVNRQWLLARRPEGMVSAEDFRLVETPVPDLDEGQVLVKNLYLSVDPTQRGWMAVDTYLPKVKLDEVMRSFATGQVLESRHPSLKPGDVVQGLFGWQEYAVIRPGTRSGPTVVPPGVPIETSMSALGLTGITAYFGLLEVGRPKPGETVLVSGAAGATGSVAAQIAKIQGCRTIGIAGGPEKCRYLTEELGLDGAIDHRGDNVARKLRTLCPDGVDVYFDNVGGPILDLVLLSLALRGRIVLCGGIAAYNDSRPKDGPANYLALVSKRGRMEGFIVLDYMPRAAEAVAALSGWMKEGRLKDRVDVMHGLDGAPEALRRVFEGRNQGKQLVKLAEPAPAP